MFSPYRHLVFAKLLLPFLVGILLAIFVSATWPIALAILAVGLLGVIAFHIIKPLQQRLVFQPLYGLGIYAVMFSIGYLLCTAHQTINDKSHFSRYYIDNAQWVAQLQEPPQLLGDVYKLRVKVVSVYQAKQSIGTTGNLLVYVPVDSASRQLQYGDRLLMKSAIREMPKAANPYEFNRRSYLAWQQYYHQSTAYVGQWRSLHINNGNPFFRWIYQLRTSMLNHLSVYLDGEPLSITASLLLGYRDLLDNELLKSYSAAGVVHILSVSGLHVGFVVWLFMGLSRPIPIQWMRYGLSILLIWVFAVFTGLSPPVLRAAIIFSFIQGGKLIRRDMDTTNSLAAAAMLLLAINPFLLMDIGFELSFAAVAGVVLLVPVWGKPFQSWPSVPKQITNTVLASIAATLATLPLTLYYFHQAPSYFVLSNLVVIPMAAATMFAGLILLIVSPITTVSTCISKVVQALVLATHHAIYAINNLPFSHWSNIALSTQETLLLATAVVLLMLFVSTNKPLLLMLCLACCTALVVIGIPQQQQLDTQQKLVVYALNKHSAIDFINGRQDILLCDDSLLQDERTWQQHVAPSRMYWGLQKPITECLDEDTSAFNANGFWRKGRYMQYDDKRIMVLDAWKRTILPKSKLKVDYLFLINNGKVDLKSALAAIEPKLIILDGSSSDSKTKNWSDVAMDLGIKCYNIKERGAYIANLPLP